MSINPSFDHDHIESRVRPAYSVAALNADWHLLPPPLKVLASAGALALAAPLVRRAAHTLDVKPADLLQLIYRF